MAQPRPSRAHVTGRIVALALLAAAPAGTPWIAPSEHTTRLAGGIPFFHPYPLMWVTAVAILPAVPVMTAHGPRGAKRSSDARRLS